MAQQQTIRSARQESTIGGQVSAPAVAMVMEDPLPWFVMPLAGPFGMMIVLAMMWLNLQ